LREWWEARAPRERAIIGAGVALLALAIAWAFVWEPIVADRARLIDVMPRLRAQAAQVAAQGAEVDQLRAAARGRPPVAAPQSVVEEAVKGAGLASSLAGVTALAEGRVQIALRPVPFDTLVRVVAQLGEARGMAVESMVLRASGEPGRVQVDNLVLRGPRGG